MFEILLTAEADKYLKSLRGGSSRPGSYRSVVKTIKYLAANPRHPGLQTHEFKSLKGLNGEKIYEAYVQQNTPSAYRVFWHYGPAKGIITIVAITSHP